MSTFYNINTNLNVFIVNDNKDQCSSLGDVLPGYTERCLESNKKTTFIFNTLNVSVYYNPYGIKLFFPQRIRIRISTLQ